MSKHHLLETEVEQLLKVWNDNCAHNGVKKHYVISVGQRTKHFKGADEKNVIHDCSAEIAELCLVEHIGSIFKLIHRIEVPMGTTVSTRMNETQWKNQLYRAFLYECLGTFCVTAGNMFDTFQTAEYDLDKDRLRGDEMYDGVFVTVDNALETDWFKVGETYEVFTQSENKWGVYSYRGDHRNGIGMIPLLNAKLVKNDTRKEPIEAAQEITKKIDITLGSLTNKINKTKTTKAVVKPKTLNKKTDARKSKTT